MTTPVALILGAGPRIGVSVAQKFSRNGYKIAMSSRSVADGITPEGYYAVKSDLSDTGAVSAVFTATTSSPPDKDDWLSLPVESVERDLRINAMSAYVAAQQSVAGFAELPDSTAKAFIFTGSITNEQVHPGAGFITLGMGKSAAAYWVGAASWGCAKKGYRFYYADQRKSTGEAVYRDVDGQAHADFYFDLAQGNREIPWHATFVKGTGYSKFRSHRLVDLMIRGSPVLDEVLQATHALSSEIA